jgi:hypothetical protein
VFRKHAKPKQSALEPIPAPPPPVPFAEEYRTCAQIHFREAEKLLERAHAAQAEDRQHEAMLLTDLSISQRERGVLYEKAARGEGSDPIVTEILDGLQQRRDHFIPAPGQSLGIDLEVKESRIARAFRSITFHQSR